jgi:hypothetical protein
MKTVIIAVLLALAAPALGGEAADTAYIVKVCEAQAEHNAQRAKDACDERWANNPRELNACYGRMVELIQQKHYACLRGAGVVP